MEITMNKKKMILIFASLAVIFSACSAFESNAVPARPTDNTVPIPKATEDLIPPIDKDNLIRGEVFITQAEIFIMESYPVQISLNILGELPTPCNMLEIVITPANNSNEIMVEAFFLIDPAMTCIQVIEPFEENVSIPVSELSDGIYKIFLNGELVGEFSYPA